jgi:eukaryotic-like serine/threonine-protein kinase
MSIPGSTRIGVYEVTALIGAGGMGEVYRAHDTRLNRDVALKVLPEAFSRDSQRMARFEREAKVLASLNHPNIAAIYGLEESGPIRALVMELVEGPTLAERILTGAVPLDETLPIARQVADAVEYAHDHNVIHRDLKPANIKVTAEGMVKVLDFGLAKALSDEPTQEDMSNSPTLSMAATRQGVILGTAAYMAPEQAKGKVVDRRADVWAFGAVLFEMLTGKQAFGGEDITEALAAIVMKEPAIEALPVKTPPAVRTLVRRCLEKNVRQRLQHMGEARIVIEGVLSGATVSESVAVAQTASGGQPFLPWAAAVVFSVLTGLVVWTLRPAPASQPVSRFTVMLQGNQLVQTGRTTVALSRDGRQLAYVASRENQRQVYLRNLDSLEARALAGAEGGNVPFFSPDGQWLGFFADGMLKKISVNGGAAITLCDAAVPFGATWTSQGTIVFSPGFGGLQQVSDSGGTPEMLTQTQNEDGEASHRWPSALPDGNAVLFVGGTAASPRVAVYSMETGERRDLVQGQQPGYAPSGYLLYTQDDTYTLMAMPFDANRLEVTGAAVPVVQGVQQTPFGATMYSVSGTGTLVYLAVRESALRRTLVWVDRQGREETINVPPRPYVYARLSPDGTRVALDIRDQENDIWVWDLARETLARLTFDPGFNRGPVWTPDGKRLAFSAQREDSENIYWQAADGSGTPEALTDIPNAIVSPQAISPDGTQLLLYQLAAPRDISRISLDGDRKPEPVLQTSFNESNPDISPDGHWLAYMSDESGRDEVYVRPFPDVNAGRWQISTGGGTRPLWNPNGRELFYYVAPGTMMSVPIEPGATFRAGAPQVIFQGQYPAPEVGRQYSITRDGRRFLMIKDLAADAEAPPPQIHVVLNWFEELIQRVPTGTK